MRFNKIRFSFKYIVILSLIIFINLIPTIKRAELPLIAYILFALFDLIIFGLLFWGLTTKIEILEDGISYKTILSNEFVPWSNVKSYGVYVVGRYYTKILKKEDYYKFSFETKKYIYISTENDFFPRSFKSKQDNISFFFDFRKDVIELIEDRIMKNKASA